MDLHPFLADVQSPAPNMRRSKVASRPRDVLMPFVHEAVCRTPPKSCASAEANGAIVHFRQQLTAGDAAEDLIIDKIQVPYVRITQLVPTNLTFH